MKRTILSLLIITGSMLSSCILSDQKESRFTNYQQAQESNFFEKGWIPSALIMPSMTNIYVKNNLDLNTYIFASTYTKEDLTLIKTYQTNVTLKTKDVNGISLPSWWKNETKEKAFYLITTKQGDDLIYIYIDNHKQKIYGFHK
ncbi:MAG: hypothetical protein N4A37_03885 [Prolixibacteraceae bacterium]|jgi:hypothetical protein|nr:hypothetical protein [Prolixibacteraceae bacterium]